MPVIFYRNMECKGNVLNTFHLLIQNKMLDNITFANNTPFFLFSENINIYPFMIFRRTLSANSGRDTSIQLLPLISDFNRKQTTDIYTLRNTSWTLFFCAFRTCSMAIVVWITLILFIHNLDRWNSKENTQQIGKYLLKHSKNLWNEHTDNGNINIVKLDSLVAVQT